jgi:serine protease Do
MRSEQRRQLPLLTTLLVTIGLFTVGAVGVGSAPERGEPVADPVAAPPSTTTTTTTPTTTTTTTTTTTPTTTTIMPVVSTTLPATTPTEALIPLDVDQIRRDVTPAVGFVTTFIGSGSGVLVGEDLLVTNAHVVWPFRVVGVLFPGDTRRIAHVVAIDARADLAILRVESPLLLPDPIAMGSARELTEGAQLYVVGYPAAIENVPDPTIADGSFATIRPWEFSGADWVTTDAPAIGGQSGGALVDEFGRLVGVTTFGSPVTLYSVAIEDVQDRLEAVWAGELPDLAERLPPRSPGRRTHAVALEGPWSQAAFVTWLNPGARSGLTSSDDIQWRALDPFGEEVGSGAGALDVIWGLATPGIVLAGTNTTAETTVEVNLPMVALPDTDDGRELQDGAPATGFIDVPGDRDWFFVDVGEPLESASVVVEAQTRVRITLYDRDSRELLATVDHRRGFFFDDPALVVSGLPAGRYVVAVEDIGAQFGTYLVAFDANL